MTEITEPPPETKLPPEKKEGLIFRASITLPNGKVIYAKQYGKRAFPILVSADNDNGKKAS